MYILSTRIAGGEQAERLIRPTFGRWQGIQGYIQEIGLMIAAAMADRFRLPNATPDQSVDDTGLCCEGHGQSID